MGDPLKKVIKKILDYCLNGLWKKMLLKLQIIALRVLGKNFLKIHDYDLQVP